MVNTSLIFYLNVAFLPTESLSGNSEGAMF